jgi:DMSO reductase family type II enzyme heme b subunit
MNPLLTITLLAQIQVPLHRTPPLFPNEPPPALEISEVQVQVARSGGNVMFRLEWKDATEDKVSAAPALFPDACAVMIPARPVSDEVFPSLQMGDADHPVTIYFFDAARGSAVMEAAGRGTTKRTGKTFPAQAVYGAGRWQVTLELPELASGTPFSVAVWNGSQQDRDGRKYFSTWRRTP